MGKRGPKPKYEDAKELEDAIKKYFDECEKKDVFPDYAGMGIYLGLSKRRMKELENSSAEHKEVFDYSMSMRESYLARIMAKDNKRAQGCMNNLKQPINGGYVDKPVENTTPEIKINLVGVGGTDAFK